MSALIDTFIKTRKQTEEICKPLRPEEYDLQAAAFASPAKWHLAHSTWFFEEFILKAFSTDYKAYDPSFCYLFNSYYNYIGERISRDKRGRVEGPKIDRVYDYRHFVTESIVQMVSDLPDHSQLLSLIELGINHEQQHQELLRTDLKFNLFKSSSFIGLENAKTLVDSNNTTEGFIDIAEGVYSIGHNNDGFCYDNELSRHKTYIQASQIENRLVTNREFLAFVQDGAYQRFDLWLDAGWHWVNQNKIEAPLYWKKIDDHWNQYTLRGFLPLSLDSQVCHISYYEAAAFAEWKGLRLPTEQEWEVASDHLTWGQRWEWTNSAYLPYPGYKKQEGAVGEYNGKFMINQMVLRGASVATPSGHSRKTYRNFFHPNERWQFTGVRLVKR